VGNVLEAALLGDRMLKIASVSDRQELQSISEI
jgi:hypothetical protein